MALPFDPRDVVEATQFLAEEIPAPVQSGTHGPNATADDGGGVGVIAAMQVTQHDHLAVARRKAQDGTPYSFDRLLGRGRFNHRLLDQRLARFPSIGVRSGERHEHALATQPAPRQMSHHPVQILW